MLLLENVQKTFNAGTVNEKKALTGVNLNMNSKDFVTVIGGNGAGKSTMLNMLAGLEKPTKGELIVAGQHLENMTENQLVKFRREKVGFIFQSFNLLGTMNAIENVALPLTFRGVDKKVREAKAVKMLKLVGLSKHMLHRPNEMSGGQQQRVGVARALVLDPEIIFADEPTGNLDSHTSAEVLGLMRKVVQEKNQTMVMVTHDNHLAGFADRIFHIIDGKIVKIETRSEYKEDEQ